MSRTGLAMGFDGPKRTSRDMRRRLGFQRAQWWRDLQTRFVLAGDKKEHTSKLDPCSALRLPLGEDGARVFIAAEKYCDFESRARGDAVDPDSGLAVEAVQNPHFGKIHPNLDDLLLHQSTATGAECDLDLDVLGVGVEDASDCSSDCCSLSAESCCSSSSLSGDCSDSDSDATDTGGPRRQTRSRSGSGLWSLLKKVKVNEVRCVGKDRRGGDVYVTVLSPPPLPKTMVELRL